MGKKKSKKSDPVDVLAVMRSKLHTFKTVNAAITLADWADKWLAVYCTNIKKSSVESYQSAIKNHIKRVFPNQMLSEIDSESVQMFILSLSQGVGLDKPLKAKTIKNIYGVLHECLQTAFELKIIPENPAQNVKLPKHVKQEVIPMSDKQLAAFLQQISGHQFEPLFKLAMFTGMRQSELLGLTWDCFNFDEGYIHIYQQVSYDKDRKIYYMDSLKNSKPRTIYPPVSIMQMMQQFKSSSGSGENYVFAGKKHAHLTHPAVRNAFKKVVKNMGYPKFRFHDLRHTYAVVSLQAGVDIKTISEFMGHYSVAFTLDTYTFVLLEMKQNSAKRLQTYMDAHSYTI